MPIAVYCLNVGHGNCTVVVDGAPPDRRATVIDVGTDGKALAGWLQNKLGVDRILLVALTHNDEDHIRGVEQLVQGYRSRIGVLQFVRDRSADKIKLWVPAQEWLREGWIGKVSRLTADATAPPYSGGELLNQRDEGYQLYCIYPNMFEEDSASQGAPLEGLPTGKGPNAASAVIRLAWSRSSNQTEVLFGGDLDFKGWRRLLETGHDLRARVLIVPHHGGPKHATRRFGYNEFARAVEASFAIVSVGTLESSRHGHPHPEMVSALRASKTTVLCTQITPQCAAKPLNLPGGSVASPDRSDPQLARTGAACAGTVVLILDTENKAGVSVHRLDVHQSSVRRIRAAKHTPLCHPLEPIGIALPAASVQRTNG